MYSDKLRTFPKELSTTRLAAGLDAAGALSEQSMNASVSAVAQYAAMAAELDVPAFAYATSAVRGAANRADFLSRIKSACGLDVDILSGECEARLALAGAGADALLDIGGGSFQLTAEETAVSFPIGCVRAKEAAEGVPGAPPYSGELPISPETLTLWDEGIRERVERLAVFPAIRSMRWAGVGGTITTLGALGLGLSAYDPNAVSRAVITPSLLNRLIAMLCALRRRSAHPLLIKRHDVIIPGALLLRIILERMDIDALHVSDADGLEGYFLELLRTSRL
jgi:exopolyphosphatase/guanosine-5'-triphosphate,3'-diphosphate pyrophosphatase